MGKQRKHMTPLEWEKEDSGQMEHPHREVKIVGEKKIGQEPLNQESEQKKEISPKKEPTKK